MGVSKRQLAITYGMNFRHINTLIKEGVLRLIPGGSKLRPKIDPESIQNLILGTHYVICQECDSFQTSITAKHLQYCSTLSLEEYKLKHPSLDCLVSNGTKQKKAKSDSQKQHQSDTLKNRFKTEAGEITRKQISEASIKMQASGYRERAVALLTAFNQQPEQKEARRRETQARWDSGKLRTQIAKWQAANPEKVMEHVQHAQSCSTPTFSKLHQHFKSQLVANGLAGFHTEFKYAYYSIDEALPSLKIAIEIDGCYWHGCSTCNLPGRQQTKGTDKRKNSFLTNRGWIVLRFPEHQIQQDMGSCLDIVKETLQQRYEEWLCL